MSTEAGAVAARVDAAFVAAATAVVGADFVRVDDASRLALRHRRAEARASRPTSSSCPGTTAEVAAIARLCDAGRRPARSARRRHRLHRRRRARAGRRRRSRSSASPASSTIDEAQPAGRRPARRDHRRRCRTPSKRVGLFYPPDPASLRESQHRRQRRRVRRRAARLQVRQHPPLRPRPRGRAADGDDHPHRRQDRQERRRLRPDAAARRIRRHAGDRHRDHRCGWCRCRRRGRRCARRSRTIAAAVDAVDRLVRAASCRRRSSSSIASASRRCARISAASRWRRPAPRRCWSSRWTASTRPSRTRSRWSRRRAATRRHRRAARARRGRASGGVARPARAVLRAADRRRVEVQSRRRRAEGPHPRAVRAGRSPARRVRAADSRASATSATATSTSTSWWTPTTRRPTRACRAAEQALFEGVVALEGSVTGEHGIGFSKAPYLPLEVSPETIALMRRVKQAFDPEGHAQSGQDLSRLTQLRSRSEATGDLRLVRDEDDRLEIALGLGREQRAQADGRRVEVETDASRCSCRPCSRCRPSTQRPAASRTARAAAGAGTRPPPASSTRSFCFTPV